MSLPYEGNVNNKSVMPPRRKFPPVIGDMQPTGTLPNTPEVFSIIWSILRWSTRTKYWISVRILSTMVTIAENAENHREKRQRDRNVRTRTEIPSMMKAAAVFGAMGI
jgi:hypothetical protein